MNAIGAAMRRYDDEDARAQERVDARTPGQSTDTTTCGAPLERRVAFPEGARALLGAAPLATPATPATTPQLNRTAPLRALPHTGALAPGGFAASLAAVAASGASAAASAPRGLPGARGIGVARRDLWYQAALYVALNLADIVSTYLGLRHGLHEGNPLMGALLAHDGFGALITYKIVITLGVLAGMWLLGAWSERAARAALLVCSTLVARVVILNFAQFALLGR